MNNKKIRSLRTVVLLIISIAFIFCEIIITGVFSTNMLGMLRQAEQKHVEELSDVILASIKTTLVNLHSNTRTWSSWNETHSYVLGDNPDFVGNNLNDGTMLTLYNVDYVVIKDKDGNDIYQNVSNKIMEEYGKESSFLENHGELLPEGLTDRITPIAQNVIVNQTYNKTFTENGPYCDTGFIVVGNESYMVCVMPVLLSDETGEAVGTFTFIVDFGNIQFKNLTNLETTRFTVLEDSSDDNKIEIIGKSDITIKIPIVNQGSDRSVSLEMAHPRLLYNSGFQLIIFTIFLLSLVMLFLFIILFAATNRFLVNSFRSLVNDLNGVEKNGSVDEVKYKSFAEIHSVSIAINDMMERVEKSNEAEQQSQISLNILKSILNGMDAYVYVSDPQTDEILFINDKMKEHFGISSEGVGEICWKLLQSDFDKRCEFCPCYKLKSIEDKVVWEEHNTVTGHYYRNTDGLIVWYDGRLVHLQHSVDISDIKKVENELQIKFDQQTLLTDISQSFISNENLDVLTNNAIGMVGEFMAHSRILVIKYHESRLHIINEWRSSDSIFSRKGMEFELEEEGLQLFRLLQRNKKEYIDSNEHAIWQFQENLHCLCVPVFVNSDIWGMLDFARDDEKWNENDINIAKLLASLLSGVISRHNMEEQLIAAKELAEQGSRAKGEFLSRMSHEMRTPMNAIIGMTNIAKSSDDHDKKEYCLDKIDNASRHLLGVINDILDMSKIEANKFELNSSEFILDHMMMNTLNVTNFRIEEKSQHLTLFIDPEIPPVIFADEQRLAQVITNLLTNAVKFTSDQGNIAVNVRLLESDVHNVRIQFDIIDTGIGISAEQQKKLFTSFEQADGSIARRFGGTGLGLAISKRIVELMGGTIWIESEEGKGSKFSFTIAAKPVYDNKIEMMKQTISKTDLQVLVVDDSEEVCEYFTHLIKMLGISCDCAYNAGQALELVKVNGSYDLLFIDWQLSGTNVIELAGKLRSDQYAEPIIIMLSAAEWSDIEKDAKKAGITSFISKPLFPTTIIDCINKSIDLTEKDQQENADTIKYTFPGKTILLAEDIEINQEIVITILEDTELIIECAENGIEAVALFKENPERYDLIFMDMHMPEMDGLEATRQIRAANTVNAGTIPIIAMTANVFKEDVDKCILAGMNDHIGKPINFYELFEKLNVFIGK